MTLPAAKSCSTDDPDEDVGGFDEGEVLEFNFNPANSSTQSQPTDDELDNL